MTQRIGALSVELSAESAAFKADLQRARQAVTQATSRMERDLKDVSRGLGGLDGAFGAVASGAGRLSGALGTLGVGLSAVGFVQMVRGALDAAGGLGELAEQAGVSTDALQILTFAGAQAGVSAEQIQGGFEKLTRRIGEAAAGNEEAAIGFANLGVSIRNTDGTLRPTERVFADIAEAISKISDPAERARVAVDVFGRAGQKLLPILSQGRAGLIGVEEAARRAGAVLSGETIAAADSAGDKIAELTLRAERMQQTFVAGLSPRIMQGLQAIEQVMDRLLVLSNNPTLSNTLRLLAGGAGSLLQQVPAVLPGGGGLNLLGRGLSGVSGPTTGLQDAEANLANLQRQYDDLRQRGPASFGGQTEAVRRHQAALADLDRQIEAQAARVTQARPSSGTPTVAPGEDPNATMAPRIIYGAPAGPPAPEKRSGSGPQPQLAAYIQQLQQAAEQQRAEVALLDQSAAARASAVALIEAEARARDDAAKGLRASAQHTDAERQAVENAAGARETAAEVERSATRMREDAIRVTEQARTEEEKFADSVQRLTAMLERGLITQETFNRSVANLKAPAEASGHEMARFGDIAGSAFEDAFINGERFADVLKGLEKDLLRLGTRILVTQPLGDWYSGQLKGAGGGGGGGFASLFSGAGSWIGSLFGGGGGAGIEAATASAGGFLFHSGGLVGTGGPMREVPVSAFAGAPRYHSGGIAGMRPDEVPAILQRGERVLSRDEVRRGSGTSVVMNISTPDANSFRASMGQITADASRAEMSAGKTTLWTVMCSASTGRARARRPR